MNCDLCKEQTDTLKEVYEDKLCMKCCAAEEVFMYITNNFCHYQELSGFLFLTSAPQVIIADEPVTKTDDESIASMIGKYGYSKTRIISTIPYPAAFPMTYFYDKTIKGISAKDVIKELEEKCTI